MQQQKQSGSKKYKKLYQKYHKPCARGVSKGFMDSKYCENFDKSQESLGYGSRFFNGLWCQPVCTEEVPRRA